MIFFLSFVNVIPAGMLGLDDGGSLSGNLGTSWEASGDLNPSRGFSGSLGESSGEY